MNKKGFAVILLPLIGIVTFLAIAGLYFYLKPKPEKQGPSIVNNNQSSAIKNIGEKDTQGRIFYNLSSNTKNAVGKRLFLEVTETSFAPFSRSTFVYTKPLGEEINPEKFVEWPGFMPHLDDLRLHSDKEIEFLGQSFNEYLEERDQSKDIVSEIKDQEYQRGTSKLTDLFGTALIYTDYKGDKFFSSDKKRVAFITYITDAPTEEYAQFGLEADKFYIQEIDTGIRKMYALPEGAANWSVRGWSNDGKRIYLTKSYYEAYGPTADGLIIFSVEDGKIQRINKADQLLYRIEYNKGKELFYGIEYKVDNLGSLVPPSVLWRIDGKTGKVDEVFLTQKETIRILAFNNSGTLIFSTDTSDEYDQALVNKVYLVEADTGELRQLLLSKPQPNTSHWMISEDDKNVVWKEGSEIWVYNIDKGLESSIINLNNLKSQIYVNPSLELNGMTIF